MRVRFLPSLLVPFLASAAFAQTFNWSGAVDGNWAAAGNWSGGSAPTSGLTTIVVIDATNPAALTNNLAGGLTLNSLRFGPSSGAHTLEGNVLIFDGVNPTLISESTASDDVIIRAPIVLNQTLRITGGPSFDAQLLFGSGSTISGSGGIIWTGGIGAFNAACSYTGATQILGGVLTASSSTSFGATSSVTLASGAALQLQSAANLTRALSLSGSGFGSLAALHAANGNGTWSGTVSLAADSNFGAINSSTLNVSGVVSLGANTLTLTPSTDSGVNVTGAINGTGGVRKTGAGIATLSNSVSNYSGNTLVSAGTLRVSGTKPFGNSPLVTVDAGAQLHLISGTVNKPLALSGTLSSISTSTTGWSGAITLGSNATFSASNNSAFATLGVNGATNLNGFKLTAAPDPAGGGNAVSLNGAITGNGSLDIVTGAGAVILAGNTLNTFTGPVSVQGNLTHGAGDGFGNLANVVTFGGGSVLRFSNFANIGARSWVLNGGGLVIVPSNLAHVINANISGIGPLDVTGIGTGTGGSVDLKGNNTFTGGLRVGDSSTVRFASDASLGAPGGAITLAGGRLGFLTDLTLTNARPFATTVGLGGLQAAAGITANVASDITGAGGLQIAGGVGGFIGGTIHLTGNNSYAGGTTVNGATLAIDSDARLGDAAGALNFTGANRLLATGNLSIAATRSTSYANLVVDTGGFAVTFAQALNGTNLAKDGAGTLRLDSANTNPSTSNFVELRSGTLQTNAASALGTGAQVFVTAGTTWETGGALQHLLAVSGDGSVVLGGGTLQLRSGFGSAFNGVISGTGQIVLENGSFVFGGANTFSGGLTVRQGASLTVVDPTGFGAAGNSVFLDNGGLGTTSLGTGPVVLDATNALTIGTGGATFSASGQSLVLALQLTGSSPLRFRGGDSTAEVRLANPTNTFVGDVKVSEGGEGAVLGIVADGSLGDAANALKLGSKFFDGETMRSGRGIVRAYDNLTLAASRTITLDGQPGSGGAGGEIDTREFTVHVAGAIGETSAGLGLQKRGGGALRLDGVNTYTGLTRVLEGELGGTGSVAGGVELDAGAGTRIAPGNSAGIFTIGGDLTLAFDSTAAFELGGLTRGAGGYDGLDIGGSLFADGTLQVSLLGGFTPLGGEVFQLIQASSITGTFAVFELPTLSEGLSWDTSAINTTGTLTVSGVIIPEPATWASLMGLLALGAAAAKRRWC